MVKCFGVFCSMNRKELKRSAKKNLTINYWKCFFVSFLITLFIGGTIITTIHETTHSSRDFSVNPIEGKSNSIIVNEFINGIEESSVIQNKNGIIGNVVDNISRSNSFLFGILNAVNQFLFHERIFAGIIILIGVFIGIIYWIFVSNVMVVGRCRFFLENRVYHKTKISRIILPYQVRKSISVSFSMLHYNFTKFLWFLTVIFGPYKYYSYRLVPYLLAENPCLNGTQAMHISNQMMDGHRLEAFLFDLSFLGYIILGIFSLNIVNLFFTSPYYETCMAEYYMYLRRESKCRISFWDDHLENNHGLLNYPVENYFLPQYESRNILKRLNYNQNYSLMSYILFFFLFSFLGWIWEVCLTLFTEGVFVNRGAFYGPWLPIYGSGGVFILILLKKYRDRSVLHFLLTMLLCGILEYGTAFYLETFQSMKWWDYTGFFLNIQGRVCLEGLLFFGVGGLFFTYFLAPYFHQWNYKLKQVLCSILCIIFLFDFFISSYIPNQGDGITSSTMGICDIIYLCPYNSVG